MRLSDGTNRRLNWEAITAARATLAAARRGSESGAAVDTDVRPGDYSEQALKVFATMKTEFASVLKPLRAQIRVTLWILLPGLAIAVGVGGLLAVSGYALGGSAISVGSLGGLVALLRRGWTLGKDQALLELTPVIYATLFGLCRTPKEYEMVLGALVADVTRLRGDSD